MTIYDQINALYTTNAGRPAGHDSSHDTIHQGLQDYVVQLGKINASLSTVVPAWQTNRSPAYPVGTTVISPNNDVVTATVSSSDAVFDPTKWGLSTSYLQRWKPSIPYPINYTLLSPNGDVVTSNVTNSGASYNPTQWNFASLLPKLLQVKGDILVASGVASAARIPVGSAGQTLVANPAAINGVDYELQLGQPMNLPGTGMATQFVGGTASGPPTAGVFVIGDFVITQAGNICICTSGGTPGTWTIFTNVPPQPRTIGAGQIYLPWANQGTPWQVVGYEKVGARIFLRGLLTNSGAVTSGANVLNLPLGAQPMAQEQLAAVGYNPGQNTAPVPVRVDINPSGVVTLGNGSIAANGNLSLSGITFSTL